MHDALETWETFVTQMKQYIDSTICSAENSRFHGLDIYVEMLALELTERKYLSNIPVDKNFVQLQVAWPTIWEKVVDILEGFLESKSYITAVSLFQLSFSLDYN